MKKTKAVILLSLLLLLSVWSACGYAMTITETDQSITIPIQTWNEWKSDWMTLDSELIACKEELSKIKKPSSELVQQLTQAEKMLKSLQEALQKQKGDLTELSKQVEESKTELKKLNEQINRERRVHRRQIWQNRVWCILLGVGIGCALK